MLISASKKPAQVCMVSRVNIASAPELSAWVRLMSATAALEENQTLIADTCAASKSAKDLAFPA